MQVRARGFEGATAGLDLTEEPQALEVPTPAMTARLEGILQAIRDLSLTNQYGSAPLKALRQALALASVAPGNATRRFDASAVHWRPPIEGRAPWYDAADYVTSEREPLLAQEAEPPPELPEEAQPTLANVEPLLCRPVKILLERLGRVFGAGWTPEWVCDPKGPAVRQVKGSSGNAGIKHESRGDLRGFLLIGTDPLAGEAVPCAPIARWVTRVEKFVGGTTGGAATGLHAARVYWGADAE